MNIRIPSVEPGQTTTAARTNDDEELLTVHDAARYLNVTVSWVYEHTREKQSGRLPFVKLGKYLRFDRRDLRAYVDAKRGESSTTRRRH
ncbi:MAG: helix-turn-helix domain-containing protein [Acidobacteriota bacterium]